MPAASSLTVWIAGAVFLAGGFAAGYVVGQGNDTLEDDAPFDLERAAALRPAAAPVLTLERPELSAEEEAHLESARAAELEPLRDVLDGMPPPDIPRGRGVVTGTVKTPEGEGVAGVEITLYPQRARKEKRPYGWDEPEDMTVAVLHAIESVRWRRLARMQTTTAADGTYRFDTVADLDHRVQAKLEGWQVHPADPRRGYQARPGATIDFVARAVARIPVSIVLPDGTPPASAMIMTNQGGAMSPMGWSAQHPYLELQAGTWELTVTVGVAGQYKSEPLTVHVEKGVPPAPLRFELASSGGIHGRVAWAAGETLTQGRVYLARIPKGQKPDPARLASSEQSASLHSWGGSAPTFAFPDLAPGRYLLGLSRSYQGAIAVTKEVEVGDDAVEVELEAPPLRREEYIVVTLLGPEGKPLAGAQLTVGHKSGGGTTQSGATVIEREDGSKWVLHQEAASGASDTDTTWWVEARHPQYGTRSEEYRRTRASSVEIRFEKPGTIDLTVTGVAGTRYEGRVRAGLGGTRNRQGGMLDEEGQTSLPGVQPGTYVVTLSLGGDGPWPARIHSEEVRIRAGENHLRIEMPPLYEIEVVGLEGRGSIRSTAKGAGRYYRVLGVAADGRTTVDGLPAGEYVIHSGRKRASFSVPGATTVRIE